MSFTTIITEGGLLPADILDALQTGDLPGQQAADFGLAGKRLPDELALIWGELRSQWAIFQSRLRRNPDQSRTTLTREYWVLPLLELLGYTDLTFQPSASVVNNRSYAISHRVGSGEDALPIHIEGIQTNLDQKPPTGRPRLSPHALVQEYLNQTEHLWSIVTNGARLRLLRDSSRTSRPSFVEFDLQAMLEGDLYPEFVLLFRLLHRTRLPQDAGTAADCWLERYYQQAQAQGGRVRDGLRKGVEDALRSLGSGLLQHQHNAALRLKIQQGAITPLDYYRILLRLVYRLLFLMVAEERKLIALLPDVADPLDPAHHRPPFDVRRHAYERGYSLARLRHLAEQPPLGYAEQGNFCDLWLGLQQTFRLFEGDEHDPLLLQFGVAPLDGDLFGTAALNDLANTRLRNSDLLAAVRALSLYYDVDAKLLRRVNYAALDVEELGSVYESLLDYRPLVDLARGVFELVSGTERKTTGSYYTRPELVQELIKSALDPVVAARVQAAGSDPAAQAAALLTLRVVDPACGSGAFLLAAARRIGQALARVQAGEDEPAPEAFRAAVREVITHCIFGVDLNPLAVDLCKLSLWIEGHNAGMPLSFLDSHIRHGNSLVGAWATLIADGIPDDAFKPLTGDDKRLAAALRKRNAQERKEQQAGYHQMRLDEPALTLDLAPLAQQQAALDALPDDSVAAVHTKQAQFAQVQSSGMVQRMLAHLWTAAFFQSFTTPAPTPARTITTATLVAYQRTPVLLPDPALPPANELEAAAAYALQLATQPDLQFFHWELEFPHVFERGGFDVVLGNPPWERITLQEREHFVDVPEIRNAGKAADRKRIIEQWRTSDNPAQRARIAQWDAALRNAEATSAFVHSVAYPLTGRGDTNTYALFAELARRLLAPTGRAGIIVPTGIATDATTQYFFGDLVQQHQLASLYDFENRDAIFPGVHRSYRFSLLTMGSADAARLTFFAHSPQQLADEQRQIVLAPADITLINPNTRTAPVFRTHADAELTKKIYRRVPVLVNEQTNSNPWGVSFMQGLFNMTSDSNLFHTAPAEGRVPLYEAKLMHQYTHRWATYTPDGNTRDMTAAELADPDCTPTPRYWVDAAAVQERLKGKWQRQWLLGWRDITNATNERTAIFSLLPRVGVGHTMPLMLPEKDDPHLICCLLATLNSFTFDYVTRQKVGGTHLTYSYLNQLPVLPPEAFSAADIAFIVPRVLELVYTAWDMQPFAQDCGYTGAPYGWDEGRRAVLRAELDARIARLYGLTRDELRYILDPADVHGADFPGETFRVLKEREQKQHGEYRTRRLVLAAWDLGS